METKYLVRWSTNRKTERGRVFESSFNNLEEAKEFKKMEENEIKETVDVKLYKCEITEINNKVNRNVICPAIYRHFKDKLYATMFVSHYTNIDTFYEILKENDLNIWNLSQVVAKFTENDKRIVCVNLRNEWYHFDLCEKDIILYKSLYDDTGIYARELDMFLSKVDQEKYPNIEQEYRFELEN